MKSDGKKITEMEEAGKRRLEGGCEARWGMLRGLDWRAGCGRRLVSSARLESSIQRTVYHRRCSSPSIRSVDTEGLPLHSALCNRLAAAPPSLSKL